MPAPVVESLFGATPHAVIARVTAALLTAVAVALVFGGWFVRFQRRRRFVEQIEKGDSQRLDEIHRTKKGTPTMGGVILIVSITVTTLCWAHWDSRSVWLLLGTVVALGLLGATDDVLKNSRSQSRGLRARGKFVVQLAIGAALGVVLYVAPSTADSDIGSAIVVPVVKTAIPLGVFFVVMTSVVIAGSSNAVNLTDGLDGLAIGCLVIAGLPLAAMAAVAGSADASSSVASPFIPDGHEIAVFTSSLVGSGLGFLWFNRHPARIFMGDIGALALGGALGLVAVLTKKEFLFLLVGGVFVAEVLSVVLQVASFKLRGKRVFLIAPLHHHFQFKGWEETTVTKHFWAAAAILAALSLATLQVW